MKLADFVGNETLVGLLRRCSPPPAALFSGPGGVGKKTLAVLLAALANCKGPVEGDLCGRCSSCVKAGTGNHPDIVVADRCWVDEVVKLKEKKKPNPQVIPIVAARELVREAQFLPFEGHFRYFVLDEAEKLNAAAANALLKTLEEPVQTTRIVLVSAQPHSLLPTIRSRCQTFEFKGLQRRLIRHYLEQRRRLAAPEARLRAAFSRGSLGTALALDLEATIADRDLLLEVLTAWLHDASFENIFRVCEKDPLRTDLRNRERVLELLDMLELLCHDLCSLCNGLSHRVVCEDRMGDLKVLARSVSLDWIDTFLYHVREAKADVAHYVNSRICFETLWLSQFKDHAGNRYGQI